MTNHPSILRCDSDRGSIIFDLRRGFAELAWIGGRIADDEDLTALCNSSVRGRHQCQPDEPGPPSIFPQTGWGYDGTPAVMLAVGGKAVASRFILTRSEKMQSKVRFTFSDTVCGATVDVEWGWMNAGTLRTEVRIRNDGKVPFEVVSLAAIALPLPHWAHWITRHSGRWAAEMQKQRQSIGHWGINVTSTGGRPGFGGGNWVRVESADAGEDNGSVIAAHLAWSGDHTLHVQRNAEGQSTLIMSARIETGEIVVAPGEGWYSPHAIVAIGSNGISSVRRAFHRHVLDQIRTQRPSPSPRKVHLNTWEALAFDMDMPKLLGLAESAAAIGVERFVLDDGWFRGRRDGSSSLGDWTVDSDLFPNGLGELIDHVKQLGMDFGLWVEPEMISPDSDLYRAHPDWCLHIAGQPRPTQRNQLVLDLGRPDVSDYLFARLDSLLCDHQITYLKWDHNRDIFPSVGKHHSQVRALYALLDRVKAAHPDVEIETCASGGGRVDFEILKRCSRFWASDNNDAIDRLKINAGWFDFLPLAATGNHVGPSPNPITGRSISMDFRAKVAVFGHMGVEADPASMDEQERESLAAHLAIYKQWRDVIHSGKLFAVGCNDPNVYGWLAWGENRGLALVAQTQHAELFEAPPVCLKGLDPDARYKIMLVEPWATKAARYLAHPEQWRNGLILSGQVLSHSGLSLPLTLPESAWLISVELMT